MKPAAGQPWRLLAENPAKRRVELFWLAYTPIWGIASAVVMLGGFAQRWGDVECLIFGVLLAAGALAGPVLVRSPHQRKLPLHHSTGFKMGVAVCGLAFGLNYTQTPFFYDVLHMHYGFQTELNIRNNPVFLYFVTVAYFSTYCVLCCVAFRFLRTLFWRSRLGLAVAYVCAPLAMAFLETALNANPSMDTLFCYDDHALMLWFGTIAYGAAFILVLPLWMAIDERRDQIVPASWIVIAILAVLYVDLLFLDILRFHVAPHFTTVVEGANGLRDTADSCLKPM